MMARAQDKSLGAYADCPAFFTIAYSLESPTLPRKPNYDFERRERERNKEAEAARKAKAKADKKSGGQEAPEDSASDEA